jgi:hypothetical protein
VIKHFLVPHLSLTNQLRYFPCASMAGKRSKKRSTAIDPLASLFFKSSPTLCTVFSFCSVSDLSRLECVCRQVLIRNCGFTSSLNCQILLIMRHAATHAYEHCHARCTFCTWLTAVSISLHVQICCSFLYNELVQDLHYIDRATTAALDPVSVLGEERMAVLCGTFSCRTVAKALTSRKCRICEADTPFFSVLACERQCQECFATAPIARLCSLEYAKVSSKRSHSVALVSQVLY